MQLEQRQTLYRETNVIRADPLPKAKQARRQQRNISKVLKEKKSMKKSLHPQRNISENKDIF